MKIVSWNINGIRAVLKKGFLEFLKEVKPDILGLQEIKISDEVRQGIEFDFPGYSVYWHSAKRPGYSGTAYLIKNELKDQVKYKEGLGLVDFDNEGRVQILELPDFFLLNIYFPNANAELSRLGYKLKFNQALLKHIKDLERIKPVILGGDFNVAHQYIDLARPKENEGVAGFTQEERDYLDELASHNFIDSFRYLHPKKIQYSWWSFRSLARQRNVGWRIDYFWLSKQLATSLKKAYILDQALGSDHAPVVIELN
jgi:exodeoxyribonuclease III